MNKMGVIVLQFFSDFLATPSSRYMLQLVGCILYLVLVQGLATRRILYLKIHSA
jgi:hypothetical protein